MEAHSNKGISFAHCRVQRLLLTLTLVPILGYVLIFGTVVLAARSGAFNGYQQLVFGPLWVWSGESIDMHHTSLPLIEPQNTGDYVGVTFTLPLAQKGRYWNTALLMKREQ
jgi:hypothetical protein